MKSEGRRETETETWMDGGGMETEKVDNGISRARVENKMAGTLAASRTRSGPLGGWRDCTRKGGGLINSGT